MFFSLCVRADTRRKMRRAPERPDWTHRTPNMELAKTTIRFQTTTENKTRIIMQTQAALIPLYATKKIRKSITAQEWRK